MPDTKLDRDAVVVVRNPAILGGRPTFRGTRVQAEILFENLAAGYSLDEILENFPTLDRNDLTLAIRQAGEMVMRAAPEIVSKTRVG
jgi:uncharacterized protein (DUF433 family)